MIEFQIPGAPVGKGRPRFTRRGAFVATYTDEKTASYESLVRMAAGQVMAGGSPVDYPCACEIEILITPPESWSQKKKSSALEGRVWPTTKPDLDNVAKAILDACNSIVWVDDKQVVTLAVSKRYSLKNCVNVRIEHAS